MNNRFWLGSVGIVLLLASPAIELFRHRDTLGAASYIFSSLIELFWRLFLSLRNHHKKYQMVSRIPQFVVPSHVPSGDYLRNISALPRFPHRKRRLIRCIVGTNTGIKRSGGDS